jgi:hypothetical protein
MRARATPTQKRDIPGIITADLVKFSDTADSVILEVPRAAPATSNPVLEGF